MATGNRVRVAHLMASPFYGGPERQMLGVATHSRGEVDSCFLSFAERGLAEPFIKVARQHGFPGYLLENNGPHFLACVSEVAQQLQRLKIALLCCSGYKPDLIGWRAARRIGIPVVSVSHGWTSATWKVRCYERLDKFALRWMDAVICVSHAQAAKVRRAGVPEHNIFTIHNAVSQEAFVDAKAETRGEMLSWFARRPRWLIGAAGRLSPEKGFSVFIRAAALIVKQRPDVGFVLFGDGPLRGDLGRLIDSLNLRDHFVLAGFRNDLQEMLPGFDINVMSSFTEGLPIILLEAGAAGVPTVATSVGGIPEVIDDARSGYLVPPADAPALARRSLELLAHDERRAAMGQAARERVQANFSFALTSQQYTELFQALVARKAVSRVSGFAAA